MNLVALAGSGALVGLGLWLILRAVTRQPVTLVDAVNALHTYHRADASRRPWADAAVYRLLALGWHPARHATDLRVTERTADRHALVQLVSVIAGFVGPIVLVAILALAGLSVPPLVAIVAMTAGTAIGVVHPPARLREHASRRRRDARRALASYLDLVRVLVAGGSDPRTALVSAAQLGHGWLFMELRVALTGATATRRPLWSALDDLGDDLDLNDLRDLAATVQLVGEEGTDPVPALTAKAASLRAYELAATRADMASASERMTVPAVLIGFAFTVFIVYPALATLLTSGPTHP